MPIYIPAKLAFNARPVFCPSCKEQMPGTKLMIGDTHKFTCDHCSMIHLGAPDSGACVSCGCKKLTDHGIPPETESFQCNQPCQDCQEKMRKIAAVKVLGGVGYHCVTCGTYGGSAPGAPLTLALQDMFPEKNQFEIDQKDCPECRKRATAP